MVTHQSPELKRKCLYYLHLKSNVKGLRVCLMKSIISVRSVIFTLLVNKNHCELPLSS